MSKKTFTTQKGFLLTASAGTAVFIAVILTYLFGYTSFFSGEYPIGGTNALSAIKKIAAPVVPPPPPPPVLDFTDYNARMIALANYPLPKERVIATTTATTTHKAAAVASTTASTTPPRLWPAKAAYPNYGALLPFSRIVAYYGNFYSTQMGILGQYSFPEEVSRLKAVSAEWQVADPTTPVIPAVDYIAISAQGSPGVDGKYRARMPASQIQKAIDLATQVNGIVILDIQVGLSNVQTELPLLEPYLKLPQVHLALDPEFSMKNGQRPGTVIGTMDASDVNFAANFLARIVRENNLPPKVLVVHRFTENMLTNTQNIIPLPEVQVVVDMDGWSTPAKKIKTYTQVITPEPVQFAGIKLFYKNDLLAPSTRLMTPAEVLGLQPRPIYIQYQ